MSEGGDLVTRLHGVGVGQCVAVVNMGGVTDSKAPACRRRPRNGLVHALNPPRKHLACGEVVFKSECGVGDFGIFPRLVLVDARGVGDGHDVSRCTRDRRPGQCRLSRRREKTVGFVVEDRSVAWGNLGGLSRRYDAVDVVHIIQHDVGVEIRIGVVEE